VAGSVGDFPRTPAAVGRFPAAVPGAFFPCGPGWLSPHVPEVTDIAAALPTA
jgi:hypothetical protein